MDAEPLERPALARDTLAGTLFHDAGDALLVVDLISERILDANALAQRLSDFRRDELVRFSLRALVRHEQGWQGWGLTGQPGTPLPGDERFLLRTRHPNVWIPIGVAFSRLPSSEGPPQALCRLRDRREQVESQRRLQRSEAELLRVLGCLSDGLYSARIEADGHWHYRYLAPAVQRLTGRPQSQLLRDPRLAEEGVDPGDLLAWRAFRARLQSGEPAEVSYRLRRPDGSVVWLHERAVVIPDEGGLVVHGVLQERPLAEARSDRLDSLARMAGMVAHDLNNGITGVLGQSSLLRLERLSSAVAEGLSRIEASVDPLVELSRQLATVAGKSRGGVTDLEELARGLTGPLQAGLKPGQRLHLILEPALPPVAGDESSLAVLLRQLVGNARDALGENGGDIEVRASRGMGGGAQAWFRYPQAAPPEQALVCLEVSDSGPGLSEEARWHLFEPYFSTRPGQRGLGLATVLGIVRGAGGVVEVCSPAAGGTTVRVLLPVATVPAPSCRPVEAARPRQSWRAQGAVLLVDDEKPILDVTTRLLATLGCEVHTARSGDEALERYREHAASIRAVLLDLVLPGRSGEQVLEELRRLAPQLPVIVLSGLPAPDVLARLAALKPTACVQKPFRLPELLELLRPHLAAGGD